MSRSYKTEGIVLKRTNIGETDRLITIFSKEYGKIKVIAKGVRRITSKRAPSLELFNHVTLLLYRGKNLDLVSDANVMISFSSFKNDLTRVSHAYLVTELLDRLLAEHQEQQQIFDVALTVLNKLNDKNAPVELVEAYIDRFKYFLLENLGFIPFNKNNHNFAVDSFIEDIIERRLKSRLIFG